jgi:hypothetical protein
VLWVLDALDDIESDLSRFHRIDDMYAMQGPKFFRLAQRLVFYQGAVAMRATAMLRAGEPAPAATAAPATAGAHVVEATPAVLALSELGSLMSFGKG